MIRWIKTKIKFLILKKRFPKSILHVNALVDSNSMLGKNSVVFTNTVLMNVQLGDYSYIQKKSEVINTEIGKFCSVASGVTIGLANHPTTYLSTSPIFYDTSQPLPSFLTDRKNKDSSSPMTDISSDVWIGQGAMIKAGLHIGVGAIVGAGAVVTKDVEAYSIVAGVPAKHIKYRFDKELRIKLLASKWWELEDEKLMELSCYFDDPNKFIEELQKEK
jgi:acetyltransferase-like isoleucine patch superfamily enzyme